MYHQFQQLNSMVNQYDSRHIIKFKNEKLQYIATFSQIVEVRLNVQYCTAPLKSYLNQNVHYGCYHVQLMKKIIA